MKTLQDFLPEGITERQFISGLRRSASFLATQGNNGKGMSDTWELVNQAVMLIMQGRQKLPDSAQRISYNLIVRQTLKYFTGGSMPTKSVSSEGYTQRLLQRGKFKQIANADWLGYTPSKLLESDLEDALGYVLAMMEPEHAEVIVQLIESEGDVKQLQKNMGFAHATAHRRVKSARKEFLELIPADTQLFTYARRLLTRFGVDRADLYEEGYVKHELAPRVRKSITAEALPDEDLVNLGDPTEAFKRGKKKYMVQAYTIKQYTMEHFYATREEAQAMYDSLTDRSVCQRKMVYLPEMKQLEFDSNPAAKPIRKTSPVEKPWVGTIDGRSPEAEVNYSNFDQ